MMKSASSGAGGLLATGKTITQHNLESQAIPNRYTPLTIALNFRERSWLWDRIDRRVEQMMDLGLEHEVQDLLRGVFPRSVLLCRPSATRSWPPPSWQGAHPGWSR